MASQTALRIALLLGMVAFGWALLSSAPPPQPGPARAPPLPEDPDGLLQWVADGWADRDASVWRHAGEILYWRGEHREARQAWRRAVRLVRSSDRRGGYTLAWSLARLGDPGAAAEVQRAVEQSLQREADRGASYSGPISRALLLRLIGENALAAEELELARLRLAAAGGASSAESLYAVARLEALNDRPEMALAALQRAAETGERIRRIGRARWAFEFGELRDDPRFQGVIDRLERSSGALGG